MADVIIDSGPITADLYLDQVPQEKWHALMLARRTFLHTKLPYDCRRLLEFVEDAEKMFGPLGFTSVEDLVRRGFELEPEQVAWAVEGLKRLRPNEPVSFPRAQELGKRMIGILGGQAGPGRGNKTVSNAHRFKGTGSVERILAQLERDGHTKLAAKVRAKEISANAAAIKVGYRKKLTPNEQIFKSLYTLSPTTIQEITEMWLTPIYHKGLLGQPALFNDGRWRFWNPQTHRWEITSPPSN